MKKIVIFVFLLASAYTIYGQVKTEAGTIASDRPGISDSPSLVPAKAVQVESGFSYDYQNETRFKNRRFTYNSILLRYRLGKNFELRMQNEYNQYQTVDVQSGYTRKVNSLSASGIGYKVKISEAKYFLPSLSLIGSFNLPFTMNQAIRTAYIGANIKFVAYSAISDRLGFTYNIGAAWDGVSPNAFIDYAACVDLNIYRGLSIFAESYGRCSEVDRPHHFSDCGVCLLVNENIQFDLSGGFVLGEELCNGFLSCGCSFLIFNNHSLHNHDIDSKNDK